MKSLITKGNWYYEMQILMLVFMWQHDMSHPTQTVYGFRWGRLYIWWDTAWRSHGLAGKIRWFLNDLFYVPESQKQQPWRHIWINARSMFLNWLGVERVL